MVYEPHGGIEEIWQIQVLYPKEPLVLLGSTAYADCSLKYRNLVFCSLSYIALQNPKILSVFNYYFIAVICIVVVSICYKLIKVNSYAYKLGYSIVLSNDVETLATGFLILCVFIYFYVILFNLFCTFGSNCNSAFILIVMML